MSAELIVGLMFFGVVLAAAGYVVATHIHSKPAAPLGPIHIIVPPSPPPGQSNPDVWPSPGTQSDLPTNNAGG